MNDDDNDKSIITMMMLISFGDTVLAWVITYVFNSCKQQNYGMLNNYSPGLILHDGKSLTCTIISRLSNTMLSLVTVTSII